MDEEAKLSSPFDLFKTSESREREGTKIDYGDFWFHIARAGGGNRKYTRILTERLRPHRRAIQTETINEDLARKLSIETFAEGCVLNWGSTAHGEGMMVGEAGEPIPFSTEAAAALLTRLPELYQDLKTQADTHANFREVAKGEDAKN